MMMCMCHVFVVVLLEIRVCRYATVVLLVLVFDIVAEKLVFYLCVNHSSFVLVYRYEGFSTYPRTYDLIHANGVFSLYQNK